MTTKRKRLGELLVEWGWIEQQQLDEALEQQRQETRKVKLGVLLLERGYLSATKLTQLLSHQFGLPFVSLARVNYTPDLVATVPGLLVHRLRVVPICTSGDDVLFVATDDPTTPELAEQLSSACQREVRLMVAAPNEVQHVIDTHYPDIATMPPNRAAPAPPAHLPPSTGQPTGSIGVAVSERPPPQDQNRVNPGLVMPSVAPMSPPAGIDSDILELSADDVELDDVRPVMLVVSPDPAFEACCRTAAENQGLSLECATLVTTGDAALKFRPIAIVLKEKTFKFDRIAFTKLSMQSGAHLIIWSDDLDVSYLEALFAAASSAPHPASQQ